MHGKIGPPPKGGPFFCLSYQSMVPRLAQEEIHQSKEPPSIKSVVRIMIANCKDRAEKNINEIGAKRGLAGLWARELRKLLRRVRNANRDRNSFQY